MLENDGSIPGSRDGCDVTDIVPEAAIIERKTEAHHEDKFQNFIKRDK